MDICSCPLMVSAFCQIALLHSMRLKTIFIRVEIYEHFLAWQLVSELQLWDVRFWCEPTIRRLSREFISGAETSANGTNWEICKINSVQKNRYSKSNMQTASIFRSNLNKQRCILILRRGEHAAGSRKTLCSSRQTCSLLMVVKLVANFLLHIKNYPTVVTMVYS